jgi:polyprenyl synthetase
VSLGLFRISHAVKVATVKNLNSVEGAFVAEVRGLVIERFESVLFDTNEAATVAQLAPDKMLCTLFAARLLGSGVLSVDPLTLRRACAAIELVRAASLCHDDAGRNATARRLRPALWREAGPSGSVLTGNLLLCEAADLLMKTEGELLTQLFLAKVLEISAAETEYGLVPDDGELDGRNHLRLARGKAGPLFAFVGRISAGTDVGLSSAIEEAGYAIGTALQLASDVAQAPPPESAAPEGGQATPPASPEADKRRRDIREQIAAMHDSAVQGLGNWPEIEQAVERFLTDDVGATLD